MPFPKCIPEDFRVKLVSNRTNPLGVLGSKGNKNFEARIFRGLLQNSYKISNFLASGEAPLCLTVTIVLALRNAIAAARKDVGQTGWFRMGKSLLKCTLMGKSNTHFMLIHFCVDFPLLPEDIMHLCVTDPSQFMY